MIKNIKKIYSDFVSNNFISYNKDQENLLEIINTSWNNYKKVNFFLQSKKYKGIYVFGPVGIGKTFLLNPNIMVFLLV